MFRQLDKYTIIFALCMMFFPELLLPSLLILICMIPKLFQNTYVIPSIIQYVALSVFLFEILKIHEFVFCLFGVSVFVIVYSVIEIVSNVKDDFLIVQVLPCAKKKFLFFKLYLFIFPIDDEVFVIDKVSLFKCKKNAFLVNKTTSSIINFDRYMLKLAMASSMAVTLWLTMFQLGG